MEPFNVDRSDKYYALFNYYLDASLVISVMTGEITGVNCAAQRFLRYQKDKLVGSKVSALLSRESQADPVDLMEQIRMFGHAKADWEFVLGSGETARTQVSATCFSYDGGQDIMLTLRVASQAVVSQEAEIKIKQLQARIDEMKSLNYELNNPLQELISRIELHRDQRYRQPIERVTGAMQKLRALDMPPTKPITSVSKPRTTLKNDNRKPCTKNSIMIVDDEINIRNLFNNILRVGFPDATLEMATDGPEAIRAFEQGHHDLIILDYNMPKMTGERVLRSIEEQCRFNYWRMPKIILCTGYDPGDTLAKLKTHDQQHCCLLKPVSSSELLAVVQEKLAE